MPESAAFTVTRYAPAKPQENLPISLFGRNRFRLILQDEEFVVIDNTWIDNGNILASDNSNGINFRISHPREIPQPFDKAI